MKRKKNTIYLTSSESDDDEHQNGVSTASVGCRRSPKEVLHSASSPTPQRTSRGQILLDSRRTTRVDSSSSKRSKRARGTSPEYAENTTSDEEWPHTERPRGKATKPLMAQALEEQSTKRNVVDPDGELVGTSVSLQSKMPADDHDLEITADQEQLIIAAVERYPALYNPDHADYAGTKMTSLLWARISAELRIKVDALKKKWRILRQTFVGRYKTELKAQAQGKKILTHWAHYDRMAFMRPCVRPLLLLDLPAAASSLQICSSKMFVASVGQHPLPHGIIDAEPRTLEVDVNGRAETTNERVAAADDRCFPPPTNTVTYAKGYSVANLVAAVRRRPALYDPDHRDYGGPLQKLPGGRSSDKALKKWKQLRGGLIRIVGQQLEAKANDVTKQISWMHYNKMAFLLPFLNVGKYGGTYSGYPGLKPSTRDTAAKNHPLDGHEDNSSSDSLNERRPAQKGMNRNGSASESPSIPRRYRRQQMDNVDPGEHLEVRMAANARAPLENLNNSMSGNKKPPVAPDETANIGCSTNDFSPVASASFMSTANEQLPLADGRSADIAECVSSEQERAAGPPTDPDARDESHENPTKRCPASRVVVMDRKAVAGYATTHAEYHQVKKNYTFYCDWSGCTFSSATWDCMEYHGVTIHFPDKARLICTKGCRMVFRSQYLLDQHETEPHPTNLDECRALGWSKPQECKDCEKWFENGRQLSCHRLRYTSHRFLPNTSFDGSQTTRGPQVAGLENGLCPYSGCEDHCRTFLELYCHFAKTHPDAIAGGNRSVEVAIRVPTFQCVDCREVMTISLCPSHRLYCVSEVFSESFGKLQRHSDASARHGPHQFHLIQPGPRRLFDRRLVGALKEAASVAHNSMLLRAQISAARQDPGVKEFIRRNLKAHRKHCVYLAAKVQKGATPSFRSFLVSGIQYVGSSKDLELRFNDHANTSMPKWLSAGLNIGASECLYMFRVALADENGLSTSFFNAQDMLRLENVMTIGLDIASLVNSVTPRSALTLSEDAVFRDEIAPRLTKLTLLAVYSTWSKLIKNGIKPSGGDVWKFLKPTIDRPSTASIAPSVSPTAVSATTTTIMAQNQLSPATSDDSGVFDAVSPSLTTEDGSLTKKVREIMAKNASEALALPKFLSVDRQDTRHIALPNPKGQQPLNKDPVRQVFTVDYRDIEQILAFTVADEDEVQAVIAGKMTYFDAACVTRIICTAVLCSDKKAVVVSPVYLNTVLNGLQQSDANSLKDSCFNYSEDASIVLMPFNTSVNDSDNIENGVAHWTLFIADRDDSTLMFYDPLGRTTPCDRQDAVVRSIVRSLLNDDDSTTCSQSAYLCPMSCSKLPQNRQTDFVSCGMYVAELAAHYLTTDRGRRLPNATTSELRKHATTVLQAINVASSMSTDLSYKPLAEWLIKRRSLANSPSLAGQCKQQPLLSCRDPQQVNTMLKAMLVPPIAEAPTGKPSEQQPLI